MLRCNTEIMKEIKRLEQEKGEIERFERENCLISFLANEKPIDNKYSYEQTRQDIDEHDRKVLYFKNLLAVSNAETIVPEYNFTIAVALVKLAQLNHKRNTIGLLTRNSQITRETMRDGSIEYTKALYDVAALEDVIVALDKEIYSLQMAIDRVNLTNMIESDI